ncbi:MAG: sce7726 family protein, partial [Flavobacteriales bacterium]|nr:sce7726 family protein [Flavobacteriales bacterium]
MSQSIKGYSANQLRDYSSLFSRNSVLQWMNGDLSSISFKLDRYDKKWLTKGSSRYLDYLKHVYKVLETNYQNEYILKNSFLNEWLINELGKEDSQIFSELKIGKAIADLAIFNGVSKVFEIKTELDTNKRLDDQLVQYQKAFNEIFLIVPASKIEAYLQYNNKIGIISFDISKKDRFKVIRKPITNYNVDPKALMQIL